MHRVITGAAPGQHVDHADGDGLNNRRLNLRPCTPTQNQASGRHRIGASGLRGVRWSERKGRWVACISVRGESKFLGQRRSAEEAARLYDAAARELHGEFARPNYPRPNEQAAMALAACG
jgi:hypothetical protein